jgi:hypothetical protein
MWRSGSNKIMSILLLMLGAIQAASQETVKEIKIQKVNSVLYKVQYQLNTSKEFAFTTADLKIFRKRENVVQEIFSVPVDPKDFKPGNKVYTYYWKTGASTVREGDELQARIVVSYTRQGVAGKKGNVPPKANAGTSMEVQLPLSEPIMLNGMKSLDADGKIRRSQWKQIGGPSQPRIVSADSLVAYLTGDIKEGSYGFELTVTDDEGATNTDRVILTIKPAPFLPVAPANDVVQKKKVDTLSHATYMVVRRDEKLKGGPRNAVFNLIPGVGHYLVSGDPYGNNRKISSFISTALFAGGVAGAFYFHNKSQGEYEAYTSMANYREFQRDANGIIIGMRGASQATAEQHLDQGNEARTKALLLAGVSAAIFAGDMVYTLSKGFKNQRQWRKDNAPATTLFISSDGSLVSAGVKLNF